MRVKNTRRMYLIVIGIALIVIIFGTLGVLRPLEHVWQASTSILAAPLYRTVVIFKELPLFKEKNILSDEVERLAKETRELQSLKAELTILERENQAIRDALSWSEESGRTYVVAKIIGRPLHTPRTFLTINQGAVHGIKEGLPVIIEEDFLVGTVVDVQERTAHIRLLTDNESAVSSKLLEGQEPVGIVEGDLGLSLKLTLIPKSLTLNTNEIIVTSGLDEFIPANIIIGTITDSFNDIDEFFKEVSVNTLYDPNDLLIVSVVTHP